MDESHREIESTEKPLVLAPPVANIGRTPKPRPVIVAVSPSIRNTDLG